jgi:hypothetical protein
MEVFNVQPAEIDIRITMGDTFDISFGVALNGADYSLNGKQVDMKIKKFDGTVVKSLSSAGSSPAITLNDTTYSINTVGFTEAGTLKYDVQVTDGTKIITIQVGKVIIDEETTTGS